MTPPTYLCSKMLLKNDPILCYYLFTWSDHLMLKLRCSFWVTISVMSKYETIHKAIRDCTKVKRQSTPLQFCTQEIFSRSSNLKTSIRNISYPNQISISFDIQHTDRDYLQEGFNQIRGSPTCAKITNAVPT